MQSLTSIAKYIGSVFTFLLVYFAIFPGDNSIVIRKRETHMTLSKETIEADLLCDHKLINEIIVLFTIQIIKKQNCFLDCK